MNVISHIIEVNYVRITFMGHTLMIDWSIILMAAGIIIPVCHGKDIASISVSCDMDQLSIDLV